jgi:poly-gamma-glutamate capsule biosynthesis protein CapA/YwtB (metallophosphatase superfamily)
MKKTSVFPLKSIALLLLGATGLVAQSKPSGNDVHIVLTGDSNWHRRISVYDDPAYLSLIQKIRSADAAFTNLEVLIHPIQQSGQPWAGGGYAYAPPFLTDEIKWVGFNLISTANNHAYDYGESGLRSHLAALNNANIPNAGSGENLAFSRAPAYVDTKNGRIALVACASSLRVNGLAGAQRIDLPGRIGSNPLRFSTTYTVDPQTLETLKNLAKLEGARGGGEGASRAGGPFTFGGAKYVAGDTFKAQTQILPEDLEGNLHSIHEAKRMADFVIASIHSHETPPGHPDQPSEFLVQFAHAAIDAGADVFVAHGPQQLRGIEIYKGKPIFYGLANFVFDGEAGIPFLPAESYESEHLPASATTADFRDSSSKNDTVGYPEERGVWESAVVQITLSSDHNVKEIVLNPITLGYGKFRSQRGHPSPASAADAKSIVDQFVHLSEPFGTKVEFRDGRGYVKVDGR